MSASQESIIGGNGNPPTSALRSTLSHPQNMFTIAEVAAALRRSNGLVDPAARILRCARRTVYSYLERYPELEQERIRSERPLVDIGKVKFYEAVRDGQSWAVAMLMKAKGGMSEKQTIEHTGADGGPIKIDAELNVKMQHEIVAGMVRGHLENGYTLAEALKNVVLLGIPKSALGLLTKADLQLSNNGHGTYEVLPEE